MSIWAIIGKSISAIFMGAALGFMSLLALSHFFPSASSAHAQFSIIGIIGGIIAGFVGIYIGWRWARDVVNEAANKLFELLLLGVGVLILGAIAFVIKML